jgi:uncharacterized membrane protein YeaQ/YmgE (transglycosylase-associated protein family)
MGRKALDVLGRVGQTRVQLEPGRNATGLDAARAARTEWRSSMTMNAQQLITWLVVGLIAGWLAHLFVGGPTNILGYLIAGLIGGFVGSWLFNFLGWKLNLGNDIIEWIVTSAIGAAVVVLLAKLIGVLM